MILDHGFEAKHLDSLRCERFIDGVMCYRSRAEHRTTRPVPEGVRLSVHSRGTEVYQATTRIGGIDIAVDESGCLVMHVAMRGAYTISNLDGFVADLELARAHAKRFAVHPEKYAAGREPIPPKAPVKTAKGWVES